MTGDGPVTSYAVLVPVEATDPVRIVVFMLASTMVLTAVIILVDIVWRNQAVRFRRALVTAAIISVVGILFGKYGANAGLSFVVYYSVPALATVFIPPIVFGWSVWRSVAYVVLAFLSAPLIHAAFFYGLGWNEYMPFLYLPPL